MNFNEYYSIEECIETEMLSEDVLEEAGLLGGLLGGTAKLLGTAGMSALKNLKPRTIKVSNFKKYLNPATTYEVTSKTYQAVTVLLTQSLLTWKQKSRDKSFVDKFVMGKKDIFVKDRYQGEIVLKGSESDQKEFMDKFFHQFELSEEFLVNDMVIYKLTNGGTIVTMSIIDPYDGDAPGLQNDPKKPRKIQKDMMSDMAYFIGVDSKGDDWFIDQTGQSFKQFLTVSSKMSTDRLTKMIKQKNDLYKAMPSLKFFSRIATKTVVKNLEKKFVEKAGKNIINKKPMKSKDGNVYTMTDGSMATFYNEGKNGKVIASQAVYDYIIKHGLDKTSNYKTIRKKS